MVSFQRMKDDLDDLGTSVTNKIPAIGRTGCLVIVAVVVAVLFVIGFAIGYGTRGVASSGGGASFAARASDGGPNYVFISNNSHSCPPLKADRLLTTMERGQSFEGLVVNLQCRGDYNCFPNQIKCRRKTSFDGPDVLEWSHIPVCYPSVLVSQTHWSKVLHARSVSCVGDSRMTSCTLTCIRDYIGVESAPYSCDDGLGGCPAWSLGDARCFMCDQKCDQMHAVANPRSDALLSTLGGCKCDRVLVNSDGAAAVWQNKRTGLFAFIGEHNGRPVYQNNATKEFLFFTFTGSEWLVGPDFRKPHAGIQMYGNDDTQCPERTGGKNVSRWYIDSAESTPGGKGKWTVDETLEFQCLEADYEPVQCPCRNYKVYHLSYVNETVPAAVEYLAGNFSRIDEKQYGMMAPLYYDVVKDLYLFSHHPQGRVWQVSMKLATTPLRGVFPQDKSCPDSGNVTWEWFNTTTPLGQQLYVKDNHIQIKCLDGRFSG